MIPEPSPDSPGKKKGKKKIKETRYGRGVDTMFRVAAGNHLELSNMADGKANLLIQVNSVMTSIVVSFLLAKLGANPQLVIPGLVLVGVALATIVSAILATRPHVTHGYFSRDDVVAKRANPLFFGNFHQVALEEYQWAVGELIRDPDYLYAAMAKDIYFLGLAVARKFHYLRIAYNIFMYGMIVATLVFIGTLIARPIAG